MMMTPNIQKLTDLEIIEKVLAGEKSLYELIVRRYNPYLYKIGRSYNYNHEDTQDLMQDTYVDAFKSLGQFEQRANFKTWISRIMLNNCFRKKEKSSYKNEFAQDVNENLTPMFTYKNNDTNHDVLSKELGSVIEAALEDIPLDYKMVFSLREINGMNTEETAEALNISEANVKVRLNRAKGMLKERLYKAYTPEEIFEFNLIYCDAMVNRVMKEIENF
jgi:RNA polymerase sigma-70 factor (ECF subfamily)